MSSSIAIAGTQAVALGASVLAVGTLLVFVGIVLRRRSRWMIVPGLAFAAMLVVFAVINFRLDTGTPHGVAIHKFFLGLNSVLATGAVGAYRLKSRVPGQRRDVAVGIFFCAIATLALIPLFLQARQLLAGG